MVSVESKTALECIESSIGGFGRHVQYQAVLILYITKR